MSYLLDFYVKGGIFMHPILLCSFLSVGFFIYKMMTLRRSLIMPPQLVEGSKKLLKERQYREVIQLCANYPTPFAKIVMVIANGLIKGKKNIKDNIEETGKLEVIEMEKFVEAVGTIAGVSTLLGLLGTISGLIKIFATISSDPVVNPARLAGGISEALNTTAFGLVVAIPSVAIYRYLEARVGKMVAEMENNAAMLLDISEEE